MPVMTEICSTAPSRGDKFSMHTFVAILIKVYSNMVRKKSYFVDILNLLFKESYKESYKGSEEAAKPHCFAVL